MRRHPLDAPTYSRQVKSGERFTQMTSVQAAGIPALVAGFCRRNLASIESHSLECEVRNFIKVSDLPAARPSVLSEWHGTCNSSGPIADF